MSRKLLATVALFLAVLLPVRGFAAHFIAACDMHKTNVASTSHAMPCHDMAQHTTNDESASNEACSLQCSAVVASCAVPLLAPTLQTPQFENFASISLPTAGCSYQSAQLTRADKPPVL